MSADTPIRVCTRGSLLARTQCQWLIDKLSDANPDLSFELVIVKTSGDVLSQSNQSGSVMLDKGMFTKEIEEALLAGDADIAIHSLKDLPTLLPVGLKLGAIPEREDPRDALIGPNGIMNMLRTAAGSVTIGTSSIRRKAQLRAVFPGCKAVDIRGNVDTRLSKVTDGVVDAIILAAAGLNRLRRSTEITALLDPSQMLPAPAQGALAIEIRENDPRIETIAATVNCSNTEACTTAERSFLHALGSGCRAPVGALARITDKGLLLVGKVISEDGSEIFEGRASGSLNEAEAVGTQLAQELLTKGAGRILEACRDKT